MSTAARALSLLAAAPFLAACEININDVDRDIDFEVSATFSYQVDAATQTLFRLENVNGTVEILGSPNVSVARVSGERIVGSDSRGDAQRYLDFVSVDIRSTDDWINVRSDVPRDTDGRTVTVNYDVILPADMDVEILNVNGEIVIEQIDRRVDVTNTNGNVRLADVHGSAEIDLVNGNVNADVTLPSSGFVDFLVVNGNIALSVPFEVSAMLAADVTNGAINVVGLSVTDATSSSRSLHGQLGGGEGLIDLRTTNGTITIRGR